MPPDVFRLLYEPYAKDTSLVYGSCVCGLGYQPYSVGGRSVYEFYH
jgi:hypothetical protein